MSDTAPQNVAVVIATDDGGKYLLQMRDGNGSNPLRWCFFSGSIEPGEDPLEAAMREFLEETGIERHPMLFAHVATYDHGPRNFIRHVYRLAVPVAWTMIALGEGAGAGFFTHDELRALRGSDQLSDWMASCIDACLE